MGDHGRNFPMDPLPTPVKVNTRIDDMKCSNSRPTSISTSFVSLNIISPVLRRVATRIIPGRKRTAEQADIIAGSSYKKC